MNLSKYQFSLISTPPAVNITESLNNEGVSLRYFNRIYFRDSIFNFFPYSEVYFIDSAGKFFDSLYFIEGLELKAKLGFIEETDLQGKTIGGYLEHDYVWSENHINNVSIAPNISGDYIFILISKYFFKDYKQSRSFNYTGSTKKTISQHIKDTILKDWSIETKKQFISNTDGTPLINQIGVTNRVFIEQLSEIAYSQSYSTSPFYTFINCNGEFYFMTLDELLAQTPVMNYEIDLTQDMMVNEKYIKNYEVMNGGLTTNFKNYNNQFFKYSYTGVASKEYKKISDMIKMKQNSNPILIRSQYIPTSTPTSNIYTGIMGKEGDEEYYKGMINNKYKDVGLCYRMNLSVQHSPKLISGKTVTIKIKKATKNNEIALEFSGNWLICESNHLIDKDGIPFTQLTISKPKIAVDKSHPFKSDFK